MEKVSMSLNKNNNPKAKKSYKYWLRVIHRDLGFLMVGICLVYAISGILLNHLDGKDPAYKVESSTLQFGENLSIQDVEVLWNDKKDIPKLNKVVPIDATHYRLLFSGGTGVYDSKLGTVDYEKYTKRKFVYWINKLHYNKVKGWSVMADFFAISLIFFAISGLFIVSKKNGVLGRGKYYLILGLLVPILYVLIA